MLSWKGFKKTHEDDRSATLRHENGHELRIDKSALSRKLKHALKQIPTHTPEPQMMAKGGEAKEHDNEKLYIAEHYADGGEVEIAPEDPASRVKNWIGADEKPAAQAPVTINIGTPQAAPAPQPAPEATPAYMQEDPKAAALAELPPPGRAMSAVKQALAPLPEPPVTDAALAGREPTPEDRAAALTASQPAAAPAPQNYSPAGATAAAASPASSIVNQAIQVPQMHAPPKDVTTTPLQHISNVFEAERKRWEQEHQHLMQDIADKHVDPDRLWKQKSALGKVTSTIGLILGGITGNKGVLGTYGRLIQQEIDRDIEAQMLERGDRQTLLAEHSKQFGNIKDAADVLKTNLLSAVQAKLASAQTFHTNAQAQKTYQELDIARQHIQHQLAARRALAAAGGAHTPEVRAAAVRFLVPEKEQSQAYKELKDVEELKKMGDTALHSFDQVDKMIGAGAFSPNQRDALIQPIVAALSKSTAGRFTEQDAGMLNTLFPMATDTSAATRAMKRQKLGAILNEKMVSPLLMSFGVPVPKLDTSVRAVVPANWKK